MVFIADFVRNKIFFKATYDELKNSYSLFQKYIDRYYIINVKYTILASTVYIVSTRHLYNFIQNDGTFYRSIKYIANSTLTYIRK